MNEGYDFKLTPAMAARLLDEVNYNEEDQIDGSVIGAILDIALGCDTFTQCTLEAGDSLRIHFDCLRDYKELAEKTATFFEEALRLTKCVKVKFIFVTGTVETERDLLQP
jgi:hypothetical protein